MSVKLVWITPDADKLIAMMARVSNPESAAKGENNERLISYLIRNRHWSPFEMASACFEIETTRDIARQILRHRSFSFQEFSQRYASVDELPKAPLREARLQDTKNRQNSIPVENLLLKETWERRQKVVMDLSEKVYKWGLSKGIAKEVARAVLPEGLTTTRMYMSGIIRSWLHYVDLRTTEGTQIEHRKPIASAVLLELNQQIPATIQAFCGEIWMNNGKSS